MKWIKNLVMKAFDIKSEREVIIIEDCEEYVKSKTKKVTVSALYIHHSDIVLSDSIREAMKHRLKDDIHNKFDIDPNMCQYEFHLIGYTPETGAYKHVLYGKLNVLP